jgi:HK97 family phage prohead protease
MKIQQKAPQRERRDTGIFENATSVRLGIPELREDGAFPKIRGYAAVFNQLSQPLFMGIRERIRPGAFKQTLADGADVRALFNHEPSQILGRNGAGTLRLEEDQHGLRYEIDPPDTTVGRDLLVSLRRRDITQSSFGFRSKDEEYKKENGEFIRELVAVDLFDVSPVTYPAYTGASVSVRSLFPDMEESEVRSVMEPFFRDIKRALDPPPHLLPEFERKLRLRRMQLHGDTIRQGHQKARAALDIQAVSFSKRSWTADRAKVWLAEHGYKDGKQSESSSNFRFEQESAKPSAEFECVTDGVPRGVMLIASK